MALIQDAIGRGKKVFLPRVLEAGAGLKVGSDSVSPSASAEE